MSERRWASAEVGPALSVLHAVDLLDLRGPSTSPEALPEPPGCDSGPCRAEGSRRPPGRGLALVADKSSHIQALFPLCLANVDRVAAMSGQCLSPSSLLGA